jgi:glycosyltransferase involved in cell wall biosynthesis
MYLHLADQDNAPCQIQESLACGTPVLAFRVGGVPEMIQDGVTGFLLNQADSQSFRKAFAETLETGIAALGGMRIACRQDSEARYAPKTLVAQIEKLFRHVSDQARAD